MRDAAGSGDAVTISVYDRRAGDYARMTDDDSRTDPRLAAFIGRCPAGGTVLDLGCGPGVAAAIMAAAGLVVDALDASCEMVALAAARPGINARQASFDQIAAVASYDGIWANFSLLHAPRADFPRHLSDLHRALKPSGAFHIAMKLGQGEHRDAIGRLYTYYTDDELTACLTVAGFTPFSREFGCDKGLDGTVADWICIAATG